MQQSLITGVRNSSGDCVAVLQADLQDPPELLIQMAKIWADGKVKFVASQISRRKGNLFSRIGSWFFYRLLSLSSPHKVLRDASDFYLFDKSMKPG
jgi:dolichol-phosphate mannosyltransferase